MTWTKLSDDFTDRPAVLEVSRSARHLLTELYVWSNRHLTNGRITSAALPRLTDSPDLDAELLELERAGLITATADRRTWQLDWTDQENSTAVQKRRTARAEIQKKYRDRQRQHRAGDHSDCDPRYCRESVTGNATGNATGNKTPPRPVPARRSRGDGRPPARRCPRGAPIAGDGSCCVQCATSSPIAESA